MKSLEPNCRRLVIIGGGFAGATLAQRAERLLDPSMEVVVVSRDNHLVFTPMVPEVAGRSISPLHIAVPGRSTTKRTIWLEADVSAVDTKAQVIRYVTSDGSSSELTYTQVVLACGSEATLNAIPGLAAHGLTIRTAGEAMVLGNEVIARFEEAASESGRENVDALLHAVVIGGGFSGVEVAGHINDLMIELCPSFPGIERGKVRVTVLQKGPRLLPELRHERLSDFTLRKLRANGIDVRLETAAREVTAQSVILESGERISTRLVVCTIGNQTSRLIKNIGLPLEKGRVKTQDDMRVEGYSNVWALGDCAVTRNLFDGKPTAPTAQFALREARQLAQNLAREMRGEKTRGFHFRPQGLLASIGNRKGVAEIYGLQFSGLFAWFLWRAVYLMKIPTISTKAGVALDWLTGAIFPPPLATIRVHSGPRSRKSHYAQGDAVASGEESQRAANFIENGEAGVYVAGRQEPIATLQKGDYFGNAILHDAAARNLPVSVKASTPLDLIELDEEAFAELSESFSPARELIERTLKANRILGRLFREQATNSRFAAVKVGEVMEKAGNLLNSETTVYDALQSFGSLLPGFWVVDAGGSPIGYFGRIELYDAVARGAGSSKVSGMVREIKSPLRADQDLLSATVTLLRSNLDTLPIVDEAGKLSGIYDPCELLRKIESGAWRQEMALN
jgi:NADH dehydrogenase